MSTLTNAEKQVIVADCFQSVGSWIHDCREWAEQFQALRTSPGSNANQLVHAATYFLFAGGSILLHCQNIAETVHGHSIGQQWLRSLDDEPLMKALKDRRDHLNHGPLRRNREYRLAQHLSITIREKLSFADTINVTDQNACNHPVSQAVPPEHETLPPTFDFEWLDEHRDAAVELMDWHGQVLEALMQKVDDLWNDATVQAILTRQPE